MTCLQSVLSVSDLLSSIPSISVGIFSGLVFVIFIPSLCD